MLRSSLGGLPSTADGLSINRDEQFFRFEGASESHCATFVSTIVSTITIATTTVIMLATAFSSFAGICFAITSGLFAGPLVIRLLLVHPRMQFVIHGAHPG